MLVAIVVLPIDIISQALINHVIVDESGRFVERTIKSKNAIARQVKMGINLGFAT
jgi:hypothetical protein